MKKEPFYSALSLCDDLYGVELDEDQFETWGIIAYNKIGNKDCRLKRTVLKLDKGEDGCYWYADKPCDLEYIEAITLPFEDVQDTSSVMDFPAVYSAPIENWIEANKIDSNALYMSGKMIHYTETPTRIIFNEFYPFVNLLYKVNHLDKESLPYLNQKELFAIATYCAYCYYYKKSLKTKDGSMMQLAQSLKADWMKACGNARTPEYLTQNEGHLYNKTQKIIR